MNIRQRQRLQKLVLPECITYDKTASSFGTAILSPVFKLSQDFSLTKSDLVARVGTVPVPIGTYNVIMAPSLPLSRWGSVWVAFQAFAGFLGELDRATRAPIPYRMLQTLQLSLILGLTSIDKK
jgi:hypothetical protein